MKYSASTLFAALIIGTAIPAAAETLSDRISGEVSFELQDDWTYKSDDRSNLNNDLYATIEPSVTVRLAPGWSVFGHAVIEPVGSPSKFENRAFEDIGLYMEELFIEYSADRFGAKAGKLNAGFGIAWDKAPGVYGTDLAEDYEISERIGAVGDWNVHSGSFGAHTVSGAAFFADTTILSESALRGKGDTREKDGGLSNTESLQSFVVALNGGKIPGLGKFGYHLAFMRQRAGVDNASDEKSFAAAGFSSFGLGGDVTFEPLAEIVRQIDQGGNDGVDRTYLTLSGQFLWKGWNLALSATERYTDNTTTANNTDSHFQISAGYQFDFGLSVDVGWKVTEDGATESRTLGILAAYAIEF
ncbi:MAG: hypothetical protein ACPGRZ_15535 [Alphaproteobacteria bacterium]